MKIWCPGCEWKPLPSSRWVCAPSGCGHVWNTFDTGGVCPACSKVWKMTACWSCHDSFPHEDWYHDDGIGLEAEIDLTIAEEATVPAGIHQSNT